MLKSINNVCEASGVKIEEVNQKYGDWNRLGQNDPHPPAIDDKDFRFQWRFTRWLARASQQGVAQALCRAPSGS
jgi:hypothetical protein